MVNKMSDRIYSEEEIEKAQNEFEYKFANVFFPKAHELQEKGVMFDTDPELMDMLRELVELSDICGMDIRSYFSGFSEGIKYAQNSNEERL